MGLMKRIIKTGEKCPRCGTEMHYDLTAKLSGETFKVCPKCGFKK